MAYQEDFNAGQKKINGALCEVDSRVISTLKEILGVVKIVSALPPVQPHLRDFDFKPLEDAIKEAEYYSKKVAEITPPGCAQPPY